MVLAEDPADDAAVCVEATGGAAAGAPVDVLFSTYVGQGEWEWVEQGFWGDSHAAGAAVTGPTSRRAGMRPSRHGSTTSSSLRGTHQGRRKSKSQAPFKRKAKGKESTPASVRAAAQGRLVHAPSAVVCKPGRVKGVPAELAKALGEVLAHLAEVCVVCIAQAKHRVAGEGEGG